jgi:hypothetical protein
MKKYKYKLNMLEPGSKMIKGIALFGVAGFALYLWKIYFMCYIVCGIAVLISIVLWILLIIESHQDQVLNDQAILERRRNGEN